MRLLYQAVFVGIAAFLAGGLMAVPPAPMPFPEGGGTVRVVQNPLVRKQLNFTPEQIKKIETLSNAILRKRNKDVEELAQKFTGDEFIERKEEWRASVDRDVFKSLADVLTPEQLKRVRQIDLRFRDYRVFSDADVQSELNLTEEQKKKIEEIGKETIGAIRKIRENKDAPPLPEGGLPNILGLRAKAKEKIIAVLTDEQKKTWEKMLGEPLPMR